MLVDPFGGSGIFDNCCAGGSIAVICDGVGKPNWDCCEAEGVEMRPATPRLRSRDCLNIRNMRENSTR